MKKVLLVAMVLCATMQINAQVNLGSIVEKITGGESTIGNVLGNLVATDKVELSQLVGTWDYSSPAVAFQSDDILKKVGGSAASAKIEEELKVYYSKVGFDKVQLSVAEDATFVMKTKYATLKGDIEKGEDGIFVFNFKAFGRIKLGSLNAYTTLSGSTLSLTFDIKKLVELAKKVSKYTNVSTIQSLITLVDSYDGITAGFKLKKQQY